MAVQIVLLVRRPVEEPQEKVFSGEQRLLTLINWGRTSKWPALTNIIHQALIKARLGKCSRCTQCCIASGFFHFMNNKCITVLLIINACCV